MAEKIINETWINDGDCYLKPGSDSCGENKGWQKQIRNCTNGTIDICKPEDQEKTIECYIPCTTTKSSNVQVPLRYIYSIYRKVV